MSGVFLSLPWGDGVATACHEDLTLLEMLTVAEAPALPDPAGALRAQLDAPPGLNGPALAPLVPGTRVRIIVSDATRRTGMHLLLPALLDAVAQRGVRREDISFLVATGVHRAPTEDELDVILGAEVHREFSGRILCHNAEDAASLRFTGNTRRGTPVWINRAALETDFLIVTGTVVLHYFAGYGGGRKAVVPGIAGRATIAANHSLNLDPDSDRLNPAVRTGIMAGNPVAEDMAEAAATVPVHLCINTVLNRQCGLCGVHAGSLEAAHAGACRQAAALYRVRLNEPADLVVASAGGAPNFLQSHKALHNAWQARRPGGLVLFLAPCPEGLGGSGFARWLSLGSPAAVIAGLRERAEINGQTALSTLEKTPHTVLVSGLSGEDLSLLGATPARTFQEGLDLCVARLRAAGIVRPTVIAMPEAGYTVPGGVAEGDSQAVP
ncbi:MAG: nickel-dependent lactate racemase [Candidatus Hydrogenedentes bacterium]|mgnify:FL=1|nr:nickel-dependent lactate racemase [Candidatus Hydrogenedentota bacterium]